MSTERNDCYKLPVRPPSTGRLIPVMYDAAGEARKATAFAISSGVANRFIGISSIISDSTSLTEIPVFEDLFSMILFNSPVPVAPGNTLLTVILNAPTSLAQVFAQFPTAARMEFQLL